MWGFVDCTRYYHRHGTTTVVLHQASLVLDTAEKAALLVPPGHGKTTIIRLLAGIDLPDQGTVIRDDGGWPLGYSGGFRNEMTGDANIRNLAGLADVDPDGLSAFAYKFSELENAYHMPLSYYSGRMKAKLGFAASFGLSARTYLADDKLSAGDERFRTKCMAHLQGALDDRGLIFVTSNPRSAEDICDRFFLLEQHQFIECDGYEDASARLKQLMEEVTLDDSDEDMPLFDLT